MDYDSLNNDSTPVVDLPLLTPNDLSKFSQLFDRTASSGDLLSGNDAKEIFVKARLPNKILGAIWFLCDKGTKGSLSKEEFIVAMHLIDLRLSNHPSMNSIPRKLSQEMWDSVNLGSIKVPPPPPTTPQSQIVNRHNTIISNSSAPKPPPHRSSTILTDIFAPLNCTLDDWTIPQQLKKQFDVIFDSLNSTNSESVGPNVLVPFLLKSSLDRERLADVWELADMEKKSSLTKDEFAIAIFLVKKIKSNSILPKSLPIELLKSLQQKPASVSTPISTPQEPIPQESVPQATSPQIQTKHIAQPDIGKQKEIEKLQSNIDEMTKKIEVAESQLSESYRSETIKDQELEPLKVLEAELSEKLATITQGLEESKSKITDLESQIEETDKNNTRLQQELTIAEGNYHANEARLDELETTLQESSANNEQLTAEIVNLESMSASVNAELITKQEEFRDIMNSVDGTSRELDLSRITAENIQKKIDILEDKVNLYVNKKNELDDYENVVRGQHEKLERKYKELEKHSEKIKHFEQLLDERETIYKAKAKHFDSQIDGDSKDDNDKIKTAQLSNKIDQINLQPENGESAKDNIEEKDAPSTSEAVIHMDANSNDDHKNDDDDDDDDDTEQFEDTIDQIVPPSTDIEDTVASSVAEADLKIPDYVEIPTNVSVEPFENIESKEATGDEVNVE